MLVYEAGPITVRELEEKDVLSMVSWLSNPDVLQYYEGRDNPHDAERVREQFYVDDDETRCIIEYEGKPIGYIQFYLLDEEMLGEYGYGESDADGMTFATDQFIGEPDYWNKGIGTKLMTSMVEYLVVQRQADRIVMDPQAWNVRAIACYEKCGFRKVRLLEKHEQHEGEMRDCWIVEYRPLQGQTL
ncbi:2-aminoglycoside phosphotransferase [Bacillus sp. FJAT-18019]|nr:2-aminoglycoside phosphotransferase [Bacillus sp. FJAT-18019]